MAYLNTNGCVRLYYCVEVGARSTYHDLLQSQSFVKGIESFLQLVDVARYFTCID